MNQNNSETILAVDIGNSVINLGLFRSDELLATWQSTTPPRMTADEACAVVLSFFQAASLDATDSTLQDLGDGVIASVVPDLTDAWTTAIQKLTKHRPLLVGPGVKTGVRMRYNDPAELGADRIADLVAAREAYDAPLIVVDLGTTTNFEVIDEDGVFVGGIIAPGLKLSARAVSDAAAQLSDVVVRAPSSVIGKSTREAMQAGLVMGEVARIDGLVDAVWAELGYETTVVATGEDSEALAALSRRVEAADEHLTLHGLNLLHKLNRRR